MAHNNSVCKLMRLFDPELYPVCCNASHPSTVLCQHPRSSDALCVSFLTGKSRTTWTIHNYTGTFSGGRCPGRSSRSTGDHITPADAISGHNLRTGAKIARRIRNQEARIPPIQQPSAPMEPVLRISIIFARVGRKSTDTRSPAGRYLAHVDHSRCLRVVGGFYYFRPQNISLYRRVMTPWANAQQLYFRFHCVKNVFMIKATTSTQVNCRAFSSGRCQ